MNQIPGVHGLSYTRDTADAIALMKTWLARGEPVACDIETYGLGVDARRIKAVTFADKVSAAVLDPRDVNQRNVIRHFIKHSTALVFHNSPFDVPNLALAGLFTVDDCAKVWDTMITARLAWPSVMVKKDLESCAVRLLGVERSIPMKAIFKLLGLTIAEGWRTFDLDRPVYVMGAAKDAVVTMRLLEPIKRAAFDTLTSGHPFSVWGLDAPGAYDLIEREQKINRMLLRRAVKGLRIDLDFLDQYRAQTSAELGRATSELEALGVKPGNGNSLIAWLEMNDALPDDWPRTPTGKPSTTATNLDKLAHPVARAFVSHKQISKIDKDYVSKAVDLSILDSAGDERIYPVVELLKATTGRMAIGGVPLHQFPEEARGVVLAERGDSMVSIDWSQIEPVMIANVAGDLDVLAGYEDGSSDVYTALGERAGIMRKQAKTVLLAQLYGEGMAKLAADLGITVDDAYELREWLFKSMPKTSRLIGTLRAIGRDHRKVFTLSGRILDIPMGTYDGQTSVQTHKSVNYFVQGGAYDMLAETLVRVDDAGLGDALYLTMHDEVLASESAAGDIRKIMEQPPARLIELAKRTPVLRTDMAVLGDRWAAA